MLLAEIHGKRCAEAEANEDWFTSAVFGHLRAVPPSEFWAPLFGRATTFGTTSKDLRSELERQSVRLEDYPVLEVLFWQNCGSYGEPDLLLRFSGPGLRPVLILIEIKLFSSKSGSGEKDQLARYLRFLDDPNGLDGWTGSHAVTALVYLTEKFAAAEIRESILWSRTSMAENRIFGLQWQDVLHAAEAFQSSSSILREVTKFLRGRGLEAFMGFHSIKLPAEHYTGFFYRSTYFKEREPAIMASAEMVGHFYE